MGNCIISIEVTGCHHNGLANDIDQMAHEFTKQLVKAGHSINRATMVSGASANLIGEPMPLKPEELKRAVQSIADGNKRAEAAEAQVAALREVIGKKLTPKARELLGDLAESMTMLRDGEGQPLTLLLKWYDESRKALEEFKQ